MSISYVLVLLALGLFGCAVWAMFWAIDDGQYDDLEQHADIALEEEGDAPPEKGAAPLFLANGGCPRLWGRFQRLVQQLHQRVAIVGVRLALVELDELL